MQWVKQVVGIKDCTCGEYCVVYRSLESLYCTPEFNLTWYINDTGIKILKSKMTESIKLDEETKSSCSSLQEAYFRHLK